LATNTMGSGSTRSSENIWSRSSLGKLSKDIVVDDGVSDHLGLLD
jgi:hypothetical protein